MKKMKSVVVADRLLQDLDDLKFRITTKEQAGEALVFAKRLKDFSAKVEKKVKERAGEIMYDEDIQEIIVGEFKIQEVPANTTTEYDPEVTIKVLGDNSHKFIKVLNGKLNSYLKKATAQGKVDMDIFTKLKENSKEKTRRGFVKISKIIKRKELDEN